MVSRSSSGRRSRLGMNVAIEIQIKVIAKTTEREFCAVVCKSSLSRDGAMYPHSKPTEKAIARQNDPTIARPTLTGIFLKAPNTTETIVETVFESQEKREDIALLN